jgi:hypothetical protein
MAETVASGPAIETILLEERRYPPPEDFASQANAQPDIYAVGKVIPASGQAGCLV